MERRRGVHRRDGKRAAHRNRDPDLAWDDGTVYLTYAGLSPTGAGGSAGRPSVLQARVDLATHRALEVPRAVWSGTGPKFPEAPHLYRVGEWWYLIDRGGRHRARARDQHGLGARSR